jgi:hypothetical protein
MTRCRVPTPFSTPWKLFRHFFHSMEKVIHAMEKVFHSMEKVFHGMEKVFHAVEEAEGWAA